MRITRSKPSMDVQLGYDDAISILRDLGIGPNGPAATGGFGGPLLMLIESLRELRGDFDRVGG